MMMATQFLRSEIMPNVFFSNTPETYIKAEDMLIKFLEKKKFWKHQNNAWNLFKVKIKRHQNDKC